MDWKERLNAYRDFYDNNIDEILSDPIRVPLKQVVWNLTQELGLSPIEEIMWDIIYCENLKFYPQYPVFNLIADFCSPERKIIIECDGKDYHDRDKDIRRDLSLVREGYKVFRLTGSQIHNDHYKIWDEITYNEENDYEFDSFELRDEYYCNTAFGFLKSIKDILLTDSYFTDTIVDVDLKIKSLMTNRIVEFKVLPEYKK